MTRFLLFFGEPDELKGEYESAIGAPIRWVDPRDAASAGAAEAPAAVVLDLDTQPSWDEEQLARFRGRFPASEAIAISSSDSAQPALASLRCGFDDYLLKPVSPEELAWAVRKAEERRDVVRRLADPRAALIAAATRLSTCKHPALVHLVTLETLAHLLGAKASAWIGEGDRVLCSYPREDTGAGAEGVWRMPADEPAEAKIYVDKKTGRRKVRLPCEAAELGRVLLWGIDGRVRRRALDDARLLLRHAETALRNLRTLAEVKQKTFLDDLTGLYNARYLRFALANAVARGTREFSVLFIDVDHFKSVNDRHGHLAGSEFLVAIGRTIKNAVRGKDTVFRYGGDEFVVILHGAGLREAREIAERIRSGVERRVFVIGGIRAQTTVSIGLAVYPDTAADLETLLQLADEAMYAAKRGSRNAVRLAGSPEA